MKVYTCKFCHETLHRVILDLGMAPPSNAVLTYDHVDDRESYYPLRLYECSVCGLVQSPPFVRPSVIFNDEYPYYSTQSPANVTHAKAFVDMIMARKLSAGAKVIEIGSNDGYLLSQFPSYINALGVEPCRGPAELAIKNGIRTKMAFFDAETVRGDHIYFDNADIICGINVFAHMPDINSVMEGLKASLAIGGVIVFEFPHILNMVKDCQFDTVYHEHYFYFSLRAVCAIFKAHDLCVFDVEEIPEHGGSLRIFARHKQAVARILPNVDKVLQDEDGIALYYEHFQERTDNIKYDLLSLLIQLKRAGLVVGAYGAAAKGCTLLNYCGIRSDLVRYVADRSLYKQGKYLPGSHIPIVSEDRVQVQKPHYILILPWNLKDEIMEQLSYVKEWGGKFILISSTGVEVYHG